MPQASIFALDYASTQFPTNYGQFPPQNNYVNEDPYIGILDLGGPESTTNAGAGYGQSLTDTLYKKGLTPSSSFGYFAGNTNISSMAQSVVLGGYDRSRIMGTVANLTLTSQEAPTYLQVYMKTLDIKTAKGGAAIPPPPSNYSFDPISCIIVPQSPYMYLRKACVML